MSELWTDVDTGPRRLAWLTICAETREFASSLCWLVPALTAVVLLALTWLLRPA